MTHMFDVDIDVKTNFKREDYGVRAMVYNEEQMKILPHPSGVYVGESVITDTFTGIASRDYKALEHENVFKIDLLSNSVYDSFNTKEEVLDCLNEEPDWSLLQDQGFVEKLPHISGHFELVQKLKPESVEDLADILALMRPGKLHLIDDYVKNKKETQRILYTRPKNKKHYFKKSHSIAYASMIVVAMNKLNPMNIKRS